MRVLRSKPAAIVGALALATTGFMAVTISNPANADAASCLGAGNDEGFTKPSGDLRYPSSGHYFKTSSNCRDINLHAGWDTSARSVMVCFRTAGCQDHWTTIPASMEYKVVASNVKDNTEYYFKFYSSVKWSGTVAD